MDATDEHEAILDDSLQTTSRLSIAIREALIVSNAFAGHNWTCFFSSRTSVDPTVSSQWHHAPPSPASTPRSSPQLPRTVPKATHGRDSTLFRIFIVFFTAYLRLGSEQWRYTGPFTRFNRFKGSFPGLGIATVAFGAYLAAEQFGLLKDEGGHHDETG
jgi:hypothetical protein